MLMERMKDQAELRELEGYEMIVVHCYALGFLMHVAGVSTNSLTFERGLRSILEMGHAHAKATEESMRAQGPEK